MSKLLSFALVLFSLIYTSCDKPVKEEIEQYIANNNLKAESTADGLYYVIEVPGSEEKPTLDNTITIHYKGTLTDGTQFDSSYDRGMPSEFDLGGGLIKGWKLGIPLFGKGGKGKLIIPPSLGYGGVQNGSIPANSILVFDIELIDFK